MVVIRNSDMIARPTCLLVTSNQRFTARGTLVQLGWAQAIDGWMLFIRLLPNLAPNISTGPQALVPTELNQVPNFGPSRDLCKLRLTTTKGICLFDRLHQVHSIET